MTRAEVVPPQSIENLSTNSPWRRFEMRWHFRSFANRYQVDRTACFSFRSAIVARFAPLWTRQMETAMVDAFERRAVALGVSKCDRVR